MASSFSFKRRELYEAWLSVSTGTPFSQTAKNQAVLDYVHKRVDPEILSNKTHKNKITSRVTKFCSDLKAVFRKIKSPTVFELKKAAWLDTTAFTYEVCKEPKQGRPKIADFKKLSDSQKRKKVQVLVNKYSYLELAFAAQMAARRAGLEDEAKLIHAAVFSDYPMAGKIRAAWKEKQLATPLIPMTPEEALSLIIDNDLSKQDYIDIRDRAKDHNADKLFPSYYKVQLVKEDCLPDPTAFKITQNLIEVPLQVLLNHTSSRLIKTQEALISRFGQTELQDLELISKYGMDGMGDQAIYKQCFEDPDSSDAAVFVVNVVPLMLRCKASPQKILWYNIKSSSTRFCRPLKILFQKETTTLTNEVFETVNEEINNLEDTTGETSNSRPFKISHSLRCTMIDGKVACALFELPECRCINCGAYPVDMNDFDKMLTMPVNPDSLQFGLSTLHAHIRFLEYVLNVSYRLDVKRWKIYESNVRVKRNVDKRKQTIQEEFRDILGLLVDQVKRGKGTTNDGNTARRFFEDPQLTSIITGFDENLLSRLSTVLEIISTGFEINVEAFRVYLHDTYKCLLLTYPWFRVPQAVHRVLMHGADIIASSPVPIGTLSEEAQESQNKFLKNAREHHTRKFSREATNEDVMRYLQIRSDPVISSMRRKTKSGRVRVLSATARSFLVSPDVNVEENVD